MISEGAMSDWSGIYFVKVVKPDAAWVTVGFTAYVCTMATGRFVGDWVAANVDPEWMRWILGIGFLAFAAWALIPDKDDEDAGNRHECL